MKRPNTCLECKYHEAVETDPYFYTIICNNPEFKTHILTTDIAYYGCSVGEMKTEEDEVENE